MSEFKQEEGYEKEDVEGSKITPYVWFVIVFVGLVMFWVAQYFFSERDSFYEKIALDPESQTSADVKNKATHLLTEYAVVDKEKGVYRIPIERAMELIVAEEYSKSKEAVSEPKEETKATNKKNKKESDKKASKKKKK